MRISPGPGRRGGFGERESVAGRCVPVSTATKIEWTRGDDGTAGATWNPVTGCTKVSEGCDHCYAETFAERWRGVPGHPFEQGFEVRLWPERLTLPLRWRRPRRVFVDSMSDLWHDAVGADLIARVFAVIAVAGQHTFQVLTKRPGRMCSLLGDDGFWDQVGQAAAGYDPSPEALAAIGGRFLPNLWLGVSVETQKWAPVRLGKLAATSVAGVRFASCEPLLGELDIRRWLDGGLEWVIAGGESGSRARPMHPDWTRSLRDQCQAAGVPFFFKLLCTNSRKRQPAAQQFLITANDRAQNGRWIYSTAGKRIPKSRSMVCRKRELDKVALFRGSVVRSDGDVEQELPASSTVDRKHPGDEPRLAINGRSRPGLMDGQNLVVHARKPSNRAGKAAA